MRNLGNSETPGLESLCEKEIQRPEFLGAPGTSRACLNCGTEVQSQNPCKRGRPGCQRGEVGVVRSRKGADYEGKGK